MKLSRAAALTVLGAVLTAVAALLTWAAASYTDDLHGTVSVQANGSQAAPALLPLTLAGLAALGAILASRATLRRAIGVLVMLLGVITGWLGVRGLSGNPAGELLPATSSAPLTSVDIHPLGPILAIIGGSCLLVAGLGVALAHSAPRAMSTRYERRAAGAATASSAATSEDPAFEMWKQLDDHRDPTLEPDGATTRDTLTGSSGPEQPDGKQVL